MKYEVSWQVFGSKEVEAKSDEDAMEQVAEWLHDDMGMTSQIANGWDYAVMGTST